MSKKQNKKKTHPWSHHRMIIKLIIMTKFISIHHVQHHTVDFVFDPPQKMDFTVKNHFFTCHQLCLFTALFLLSASTHHSLPPSCPVCVCVRLCVRLCAEGRVQVRRGFRRWAWRVLCRTPTSWRLTLSSSLTTPSWAGTAARWASDLRAALCWPVRPCNTPRLPFWY